MTTAKNNTTGNILSTLLPTKVGYPRPPKSRNKPQHALDSLSALLGKTELVYVFCKDIKIGERDGETDLCMSHIKL